MAVETLKIVLTADNKQAIAGMNQTIASLDKVSVAGAKTGSAVTKVGAGFNGLAKVIGNIPSGLTNVSGGLSGLAGQAAGVEMAFGGIGLALAVAMMAFEAFNNATTVTNDWWKAANKNIAEFDVNIINATNNISAAREGVMSKEEALKKYNDSLGSTVGYAKSLDEAEKLMADNAATVSQAIMLKTQAQILYQKSAELSAKTITGEVFQLSLMEKATIVAKSAFGGLSSVATNTASEMGNNFASATAEAKKLKEQGDLLTKQSLDLQKTLAGSRTAPPPPPPPPGGSTTKQENAELERQIQIVKRLQATMGQGTIGVERQTETKDLTKLKLTLDGNTALNQVKQQQIAIDDQLNARNELANQLTDRAMQSLSGVVNAMANGQNVGQAFGEMFKRLAIDIAMAAAKAAILQGILLALPGFGAASAAAKGGQALGATLAGGAMPKAGGGGFLKILGSLLGFSKGGTVSGPQSGYPVMLHGTEHIVRPDQMKSIIASAAQMGGTSGSRVVVEGRIRGNDIFLSQQRTGTFRNLTT